MTEPSVRTIGIGAKRSSTAMNRDRPLLCGDAQKAQHTVRQATQFKFSDGSGKPKELNKRMLQTTQGQHTFRAPTSTRFSPPSRLEPAKKKLMTLLSP